MFDLHYDLLSILYLCYLKDDFSYIEEIKNRFNENNVKSLIANLYFMSIEEMFEETHLYGEIDVVEMFKISTKLYKKYFPNIPCIFSIEGCDYINSLSELDELYNLGLRSLLLVWNNRNKYGSGPRTDCGLSKEGIEFIEHAQKLGIAIDLSHANDKTFDDMMNIIEKNSIILASHSNVRNLTNVLRNLTDKQLNLLKNFNGIVGIVSYKAFLEDDNYLEHIKYAVEKIGIDNVCVSSDDMTFDLTYKNDCLFSYETIYRDTKKLLLNYFSEQDAEKILYGNAYRKLNSLFYEED